MSISSPTKTQVPHDLGFVSIYSLLTGVEHLEGHMACSGRSIKSFFKKYQTFDIPNSVKIGIVCMEEDPSWSEG